MRKLVFILMLGVLFSCKDNKKEDKAPAATNEPTTTTNNPPPSSYTPSTNSVITVEGKDINLSGSILVDKDPKKLQAGAPYRGMITSSSGPDNEGYVLRFVFDTKPGVYPVTGISYGRGKDDKAQQFGGLLGGEEKIYDSKVNLTECTDLGDNGAGGHKWKISGSVENVTIPALSLMLIDKTANHPKEIKVDKITFNGITFDDNAEEMLKKAMEMLEKKK